MAIQDLINQPVSAFVVAVGSIGDDDNLDLEGTAFLIGGRGFMLTAAHVAEALKSKSNPIAIFLDHSLAPSFAKIVEWECHPTEDVAVLKLENDKWESIHELSPKRQFGSAEVMMWAYPENVAKEHQTTVPPTDPESATVRPDLVYFQGYIRRRINRELPVSVLRGRAFYEVSQIGGSCASGAPVTLRQPDEIWKVIGVYIGEQTSDARREIGIVVRADAFLNWTPAILGNAVSAERPTRNSAGDNLRN